MLRTNEGVTATESDLAEIAVRLPQRPRRAMVGEEALESVPATDGAFDDPILSEERHKATRRVLNALGGAMQTLGDQDRLILRLKFQEGLGIADIARALHLEQKPLYRRLDALLDRLRSALEAAGIDRLHAAEIVNREDVDISLALLGGTPGRCRLGTREGTVGRLTETIMAETPLQRHDDHGTGCLDAELLASYVDGRATSAERTTVEAHLAQCEDCYFAFSETVREQAQEDGARKKSERARWVPKAAAGLAAAAALVVAVAVGTSYYSRPSSTLVVALSELDAASGPYRRFEPRFTALPTYRPLVPATRSAAQSAEITPALREAAARVEKAAASGTGVQETAGSCGDVSRAGPGFERRPTC